MPNLPALPGIQRNAMQIALRALRMVGALRSGQNLSADEGADILQSLNDMLDSWSARRVLVFSLPYTTTDQNSNPLMLTAGKQHYTLGNVLQTEDFLMQAPARIERASVLYSASQQTPTEVPLEMLDSVGWQSVANKSTPSLLPQQVYIERNPNGLDWDLYFWPVPTQGNPIVLYPWAPFVLFPNLQAKFAFPPAYARAITMNFAVELAAEFPCDLAKLQLVMKLASGAKSEIVSINSRVVDAWVDSALLQNGAMGNIFTSTPTRSKGF